MNEKFDRQLLFKSFESCLIKCEYSIHDVSLSEYITAYEEIKKFLRKLGTLFGFVVLDVSQRLEILKKYMQKHPEHYGTLHSFLKYEKSNIMFETTSATQTLLPLHRALRFITLFLERLHSADTKFNSTQLCTQTYEETIAKYHPWVIRQGAKLAMMGLPKRDVLVGYIIPNEDYIGEFRKFIENVQIVYNISQIHFDKYPL
ncbi:unnamed protein product [Brachionus calyciflorus]|uniref:Glycolipid transfer protein domain-containing protein n=1 Tax=Brachionus calyciflorus TaxID=104777 RepID=A0A814GIX4_9BILA|nr:unnamed protein product [Brachionus calyciflorus]